MKHIPIGIKRDLRNFDKNLRIRWSKEKNQWIVEEKVKNRNGLYKPVKYYEDGGKIKYRILPENSDRYIQYRDGYAPVCYIKELNTKLIQYLHSIRWDKGGKLTFEQYLRQLDEQDEREEQKRIEKIADRVSYEAGEIYDYITNRGSQWKSFK